MDGIYLDPELPEDLRRARLYSGDLFLLSPSPATRALVAFARTLVEEAFAPGDPRTVHQKLPVEEVVRILAELKPRFIHHPRCKELLRQVLVEAGCDPQRTYFDVPRLRTSFPSDYLTTGIAYAFHPHRDTWYSAPQCQINWWMPIYPVQPDNGMAFHPRYFTQPLRNSSRIYNYRRWNAEARFAAAQQIKTDSRPQPKPEEPVDPNPSPRLVPPPAATILFSGAQLHSSVPNTSGVARFSIDFRTVNLDDVWARRGAPNLDSECTGTNLGDFLRGSDFQRIAQEAVDLYDTPERPSA